MIFLRPLPHSPSPIPVFPSSPRYDIRTFYVIQITYLCKSSDGVLSTRPKWKHSNRLIQLWFDDMTVVELSLLLNIIDASNNIVIPPSVRSVSESECVVVDDDATRLSCLEQLGFNLLRPSSSLWSRHATAVTTGLICLAPVLAIIGYSYRFLSSINYIFHGFRCHAFKIYFRLMW